MAKTRKDFEGIFLNAGFYICGSITVVCVAIAFTVVIATCPLW